MVTVVCPIVVFQLSGCYFHYTMFGKGQQQPFGMQFNQNSQFQSARAPFKVGQLFGRRINAMLPADARLLITNAAGERIDVVESAPIVCIAHDDEYNGLHEQCKIGKILPRYFVAPEDIEEGQVKTLDLHRVLSLKNPDAGES